MICFNPDCDSKEFKTETSKVTQNFRGIPIDFFSESEVCVKCGSRQLTDQQFDKIVSKTKEIYAELNAISKNNSDISNN